LGSKKASVGGFALKNNKKISLNALKRRVEEILCIDLEKGATNPIDWTRDKQTNVSLFT